MARIRNRRNQSDNGAHPSETEGLGTFGGVFTPSILTILGVIMYLRFGWVLGNVGLVSTLAIVTLATSITFLTGLSISAIATDQKIRGGGAYFMISRSLGVEAGGAIGIPLYFAQALSIALYTIGFAESVVAVFPVLNMKLVGVVTTVAVTLVALKSASAAIKAQYVIMAAIGLSLLSLLFGHSFDPAGATIVPSTEPERLSFWPVFAVFFPAVTGIMAGVNMSGDLKDASRSIPRGTLAAIGVGYLIYIGLPLLLQSRVPSDVLVANPLVMRDIAFWGDAILLGVWGATLSSAVGSILGAPRVLQALARDGVVPPPLRFLGRGSGKMDEPRIGTAVTFVVALSTVLIGDLNVVAPILTMFFLTTYGVLNVAAGIERFLGNPSYRPRFKVHWIWSVIGALGCVAVMFLINTPATVVAIVVVVAIFVWLERRELKTAWGDVRGGVWMAITQAGLRRTTSDPDPKNWRPHLLVLSGAPSRRKHLIDFATSITHNRALMTVSTIIPGSVPTERLQQMESAMDSYLTRRDIRGLVRILSADDPFEGGARLVEAYGLGLLAPNTVLLGASENEKVRGAYCEMITRFNKAKRNVAVMRYNDDRGFGNRRRIDIWWGGLKKNGGLMIVLAYLLETSSKWRYARIRIKMVVDSESAAEGVRKNIEPMLQESRTGAEADIILSGGTPFEELLHKNSSDADLVLMGMADPGPGFAEYYSDLQRRTAGLPTTVFVLAAEKLAFGEIVIS